MKTQITTAAEKRFANAMEIIKTNGEPIEYLPLFLDSVKYSKTQKLSLIAVAEKNGYSLKLDGEKLFNKHTKRYFTCNNIIWNK